MLTTKRTCVIAVALLAASFSVCLSSAAHAYSLAKSYQVAGSIIYSTVVGNIAYEPAGTDGLYAFDITDPTDPQDIGVTVVRVIGYNEYGAPLAFADCVLYNYSVRIWSTNQFGLRSRL